ncbi:MAG TPA: DUF58 domain-containing protein [Candidatus Dormibacteraeota bacterium]|jgi:uncharacterized protein (DUF58 family)|nr:DUF58 domain-containing protein [Candidatus Dormibacteraeota bacterium]
MFKSMMANIDREAWQRFFMAVAGLGLAFAAAVFSSVARERGNVLATAIFAVSALFLALIVGLLTVPFLARRVAAARMKDAFDYELTRVGLVYLLACLVIGIAALNTANNLLFIVLAAMLAAIGVSGVGSAAVLRRLELDVIVPKNAFAKVPVQLRVNLINPRLWMPAFSVKVFSPVDKKKQRRGWEWSKTEFVFPKKKRWLRMPDYTLSRKAPPPFQARILTRPVYFTFVAPQNTAGTELEVAFPRRGHYSQEGFNIATRFPFSFLIKSRKVRLERDLVVYPSLLEPDDFLDVLPMITGDFVSFMRGRGTELYRIREATPQDPGRFVDWKATAKTGHLKVREFTREDERRLRLVFDNPEPGHVSVPAYERAVSLAASLACHFNTENIDLSYAGSGYEGGLHLADFLRYLATVQPDSRDPRFLDALPVSQDYNVILTSRKPGSLPSALWHSSYVIYM